MSESKLKKKSNRAGKDNLVWDDKLLKKVEQAAAEGNTYTAICDSLNIGESTLYKHKKKNREFREAIKKGRGKAVSIVENELFKDARQPGNTVAKIYFLKNRCPEEWKDKHEVETIVEVGFADKLTEAFKRDAELQKQRREET